MLAMAIAFIATIAPALGVSPPVTVTITDRLSEPDVRIEPGTTVTWINQDAERHRIRSTAGPADIDSGNLDPGAQFVMTFDVEGTYSYQDDRNPDDTAYHGTITVSAEASTPPPPGGSSTVDIIDNSYRPANISVSSGTEVVWRNLDGNHTVTARDRSFDSGIFDAGTFRRTFNNPGSFEYFCTLHPEMVGTVTVTGSSMGEDPPPPEPPPTVPPDPAPPGDVRVVDNAFSPRSVTISTGSTLVWSNAGALPHTVTARSGAFDSGLVMPSGTYRRTFNNPGSFEYFCTLHPEMVGTVTVTGASTGDADADEVTDPSTAPPGTTQPPGGSGTDSGAQGQGATIDALVVDLDYDPRELVVEAGTTIRWTNVGDLPHTVTDRDGAFDSDLMLTDQTYQRTFDSVGAYEYFCTLHPNMVGTVTVVEAGTAAVSAGVDPGGGDTVVAAGPEISEDSGSQSAALGAMAIVAVLAIASVVAFGIGTTRSSSAGPGGQG
jgi:plastocyanin